MAGAAGPRKAVTLRDIAADTGYSITAVSHALNDRSDISDEAKSIIAESAHRLGYRRSRSAAGAPASRSGLIAVIVGDTSNPFFAFMTRIIENELRRSNYTSFFMNTDENEEIELECLKTAARQNVDGIIWCPAQQTENNLTFLENLRIPFVLIGRCFRDHYKAGRLVAEHLISKGHYRTVYIDTLQQNSSSVDRYAGFISAYRARSMPFQTENVFFDNEGRYFSRLFRKDGSILAEAIVCYNDVIAWDVLARSRMLERGKENAGAVPFSIIAFDNLHSFLPLPFPLTSVSASKVAMPRRVEMLLRQIDNPEIPDSHLILDVELIDRGSVHRTGS